jgi:hypothetical protein
MIVLGSSSGDSYLIPEGEESLRTQYFGTAEPEKGSNPVRLEMNVFRPHEDLTKGSHDENSSMQREKRGGRTI